MSAQRAAPPQTKIGDYLHETYGSKNPNTHIRCFYMYIRLGQDVCLNQAIQQKAIDALNNLLGPTQWVKTKPGWFGLLFVGDYDVEKANERTQEGEINKKLRLLLIKRLREHKDYKDIHILFSRACLYKEKSQEITTETIGDILEYMCDAENTHIECFYLFVQGVFDGENFVKKQINSNDVNVHSEALKELETLPGNWKSVTDGAQKWPGIFFSYFPKCLTEREREIILNAQVRMPLIKRLEAKLTCITPRDGSKIKVQVILTRACKYTDEKMDIL